MKNIVKDDLIFGIVQILLFGVLGLICFLVVPWSELPLNDCGVLIILIILGSFAAVCQ